MVPPYSDRISRVPPYSRTRRRIAYTGLSPTMALLSRRFYLSSKCHWPDPHSLATTNGISIDVFSYGYLDVSVPRVRFSHPMYSDVDTPFNSEVGSPIRKSPDQSLFAAPQRLSQRITSFIACAYQGIHQTPLRHLIVLITNDNL